VPDAGENWQGPTPESSDMARRGQPLTGGGAGKLLEARHGRAPAVGDAGEHLQWAALASSVKGRVDGKLWQGRRGELG
jgi:hypothetical protein